MDDVDVGEVANFDISTEEFVQSMRNKNTVRKTQSDINRFKDFLQTNNNEQRALEELPRLELDSYLARFFMSTRKKDGEEYEPDSLKQFQCSINRYLSENKSEIDVIKDKEFKHSRDVLVSKRKQLKQLGKGNRPNRADPFTPDEMELLYERNYLGMANPRALVHTMFLNNTLHFGMRTRLEHVELRWGDIELKQNSTGEEFLLYTERATKTRTGQSNDSRPFQPKMFADPENPRCPVHAYKVFKDKRPAEMLKSESPFYIGVARSSKDQFDKWFINQAMGKNTIGSIVKKMCEEAGITGRKVNHSARKTGITSLVHAGVQNTVVMQLSGHKNVNSINSYSTASEQQQKEMSSILTNYAGKPATASSTSISNFQNRTTKATVEYSIPNDHDDEVLVSASQEIVEQTLKTIQNFETNEISDINVSATSNMHVQDIGIAPLIKYIPQNVLSGATINGNVVLQFDKLPMSDYENKENSGNKRKRRVRVIESDSDSE